MKNFVSAKTAQELKELGFPQPEPEVGQFWYLSDIAVVVVGDDRLRGLESGNAYSEGFAVLRKHLTFAPTATDILVKMPEYALRIDHNQRSWTVWRPSETPPENDDNEFYHENPAEAAALAFKAKKK